MQTSTNLPSLFQLCKHDYGAASPLPDHPPEVLHGVLQRTLARHVGVFLTVPLRIKNKMKTVEEKLKEDLKTSECEHV